MPTEATWYEEVKTIVYKLVAGEVQFQSHQTISLKNLFRSLNITNGNRLCFVTELSFLSSWKFWRYCLIRRRSWNTNYSSIPVSRSLYLPFVSCFLVSAVWYYFSKLYDHQHQLIPVIDFLFMVICLRV